MEKTKSYTKTIVVVEPNGASMPVLLTPVWDVTEGEMRYMVREDISLYGGLSEVQSVVECHARHLLSILYRSGTVKVISYIEQ